MNIHLFRIYIRTSISLFSLINWFQGLHIYIFNSRPDISGQFGLLLVLSSSLNFLSKRLTRPDVKSRWLKFKKVIQLWCMINNKFSDNPTMTYSIHFFDHSEEVKGKIRSKRAVSGQKSPQLWWKIKV